jgi:hypothetical protein
MVPFASGNVNINVYASIDGVSEALPRVVRGSGLSATEASIHMLAATPHGPDRASEPQDGACLRLETC